MLNSATGCFDVARVDLRLDTNADDKPHVIEINSLPGMTSISDLTLMAEAEHLPQMLKALYPKCSKRLLNHQSLFVTPESHFYLMCKMPDACKLLAVS
jgi:hypothetical protein